MVKVYVGVGHGGSDPGACANGMRETDLALTIANYTTSYLRASGVQVEQSRTSDVDDELSDKIDRCNDYDPDVAIDVHINAGGGTGFEIWKSANSGQGQKMAELIEAQVEDLADINSRGIKYKLNSAGTDYFGWLRCVDAPSLILEAAFIDGPTDAAFLADKKNLELMGQAYAKGILQYLGVADKGASGPQEATESEEERVVYKTFDDVPVWAQATVKTLLDKGAIRGDGDGNLNLSEDFCRIFVILNRLGKL